MRLEEHEICGGSGGYIRNAWWLPAANATTLCVFLDAEYYLQKMNAAETLVELQASGAIPAVHCLFVSNASAEARQEDYICNEDFNRFICEDVVAWARTSAPGLNANGHTICGLSLSGLAAAFLTLRRPEIFSRALCQSGSFWWNDEWLLGQIRAQAAPSGRYWISVGNKERQSGILHVKLFQDVPQVDAAERMSKALAECGCEVHYNLFEGGHEITPWKDELPLALAWLYEAKSGEEARLFPYSQLS